MQPTVSCIDEVVFHHQVPDCISLQQFVLHQTATIVPKEFQVSREKRDFSAQFGKEMLLQVTCK